MSGQNWKLWSIARRCLRAVVTRARIVLWRAENRRKKEIAELSGVSRPTVDLWLSRYESEGVAGLLDRLLPDAVDDDDGGTVADDERFDFRRQPDHERSASCRRGHHVGGPRAEWCPSRSKLISRWEPGYAGRR